MHCVRVRVCVRESVCAFLFMYVCMCVYVYINTNTCIKMCMYIPYALREHISKYEYILIYSYICCAQQECRATVRASDNFSLRLRVCSYIGS